MAKLGVVIERCLSSKAKCVRSVRLGLDIGAWPRETSNQRERLTVDSVQIEHRRLQVGGPNILEQLLRLTKRLAALGQVRLRFRQWQQLERRLNDDA